MTPYGQHNQRTLAKGLLAQAKRDGQEKKLPKNPNRKTGPNPVVREKIIATIIKFGPIDTPTLAILTGIAPSTCRDCVYKLRTRSLIERVDGGRYARYVIAEATT